MSADSIHIIGARQHNLRNIEVVIPRNRLVVITGMSGSGKSSLAFNTLYAEGQRRYVESLSAYARQFISQMDKPDVDRIEGLSPAIAIAQRSSNPNPRSTTATTTEIYDYLRILYAAVGVPHDPGTGEVLSRSSVEEIVDEILAEPEGTRAVILAPKIRYDGRSFKDTFQFLLKQGFVRARIGGEIVDLETPPALPAKARPEIDLVVDRLAIRADARSRIYESVETALRWSQPRVQVTLQQRGDDSPRTRRFTTTFSNPETGFTMPELTPRHFSFNGHLGACPQCHGLGSELVCDPQLLVPDPSLSIAAGAIKSWWARNKKLKAGQGRQILALADHFGADLEAPFDSLPQAFAEALFHGTGDLAIPTGWKTGPSTRSIEKPYEGLVTQAERLHENSKSEVTRRNVRRFMAARTCERCEGRRLRDEMLAVTLSGKDGAGRSIRDFTALDVAAARRWIATLSFEGTRETVARPLLDEISKRLCFLDEVGLGYLTLDRQSSTLSGGESQRIRLATQLGSALAGVLYVLDEPTIGLHPSDVGKLIATLENLRDLGNSVVVVEHEQEMMRAADLIIDLGPGAGPEGGEVVATGTAKQLEAHPVSLTGAYLSGARRVHPPEKRIRPPALPRRTAGNAETREALDSGWLTIEGAGENNLAEIDVSLPLGCLVCVTGVSGSGKSTLIDSILRRALFRHFHGARDIPGAHRRIRGLEQIDKAIVIDQSPLGRSPRSNPATAVGAFAPIRELFSQLPLSRSRGYAPGRFSFNVAGGRCETCQGAGFVVIDMHFLSDVHVSCESCEGKRYQREILDVAYKGRSIAQVLEFTVAEAGAFFAAIPAICGKLRVLEEVGLGYLKLGQSATTLSGGEAQRVKLANELSKRATGKTVYLLDEPTTGLHFADVDQLVKVFYKLRDAGNSLVVIEHSVDVIKCADWVIDLGPGGGPAGGRLVAQGPPEKIAACKASVTGAYLRGSGG